jgi:hypothetical protein
MANMEMQDYALIYAFARGAQAAAICLLVLAVIPLVALSLWTVAFLAFAFLFWKAGKQLLSEIPAPLLEKFLEVGLL